MNHFTFALVASLCVFAQAQAGLEHDKVVDVQQIQTILKQKNAKWTAKETWVSKLSKTDAHRMLGVKNPRLGALTFDAVRVSGSKPALQPALDWRNNNGNWLGPILNQGNCGSCVAFATIGVLEAQSTITSQMPWLHPTYSAQSLFSCGGASCDTGWDGGSAVQYLQNTGTQDEACMPYTSGSTGQDVACSQQCADASSRTVRISGYTHIGNSASALKAALAKGPVITSMMAYDDFMVYSSGVYTHTTGTDGGGHEVSIVGYDDTKRAWLVRNSWGTEWGMQGFAWVSYDDPDSGVGQDSYGITLTPAGAYTSVQAPTDRQYVSGVFGLTSEVSSGQDASAVFQLTDDQGKVTSVNCKAPSGANTCTVNFDTRTIAEGHYQVSSTSGKLVSQVREFFVINSVPKMALSFTAAPGTDLSKVNGGQSDNRPEFLLTSNSSPVPFQHVIFQVIDSSGTIVSTKDSDFIVPNMNVGWRTMEAPNGVYTIRFHGEINYNGTLYSADSSTAQLTVKN